MGPHRKKNVFRKKCCYLALISKVSTHYNLLFDRYRNTRYTCAMEHFNSHTFAKYFTCRVISVCKHYIFKGRFGASNSVYCCDEGILQFANEIHFTVKIQEYFQCRKNLLRNLRTFIEYILAKIFFIILSRFAFFNVTELCLIRRFSLLILIYLIDVKLLSIHTSQQFLK